jgi:uridine phosphorylase
MFACIEAAKEQGFAHHIGIARSHDSFYTIRKPKSTLIGRGRVCWVPTWKLQRYSQLEA